MSINDVLYDEGGAVYNVRNTILGATPNDTSFDNASVFSGLAAGSHYFVPAGAYTFLSDSTIPDGVVLEFAKGASLKPASGKVVTIRATVIAGPWTIFDYSAGGSVVLATLSETAEVLPEWWAVGASSGDQVANLNNMIAAVPDGARIRFLGWQTLRLDSTWAISNREGLVLTTGRDPRQGSTPAVKFTWGGAAGSGPLVSLDRCRFCTLEGFVFEAANVDVAIDLDGATGAIGTQCTIRQSVITNASVRTGFVGIRISETATTNQEYHRVEANVIAGGGETRGFGASISSGSTTLSAAAGTFVAGDVGKRVRVAGAGAGGAPLDTTITAFTSGSLVTVAVAASTTVAGAYTLLGASIGKGVRIGPSANAKRIGISNNNFTGLSYAIDVAGGSMQSLSNSFTDNEANIHITNLSEPCLDIGANSEFSRQHVDTSANYAFNVQSARLDVSRASLTDAFVNVSGPGSLFFVGNATENALPAATAHVFGVAQGNRFVLVSNWFSPSATIAQLGLSREALVFASENVGVSDAPAATWLGGTSYGNAIDATATLSVVNKNLGGGLTPLHTVAIRGEANTVANAPTDAWLVGVQGSGAGESDALNNVNFRALEAQLPISSSGQTAKLLEGLRVISAALSNGSAANRATGIVIEPMTVTGVSAGRGIDQQGSADKNFLAGRTFQAAPASAPTDADIPNGQISFYVDEGTNQLKVRVRYSGGTYKTGTVALA